MTRKNILVITDETSKAPSLENRISKNDFKVSSISLSESQKNERIISKKPDLLLLSLEPANFKASAQIIKKLRKISDIPVLYLSSTQDEKELGTIMTTRPSGFLMEPVSDTVLNLNIIIALERYHYERKLKETDSSVRRMIRDLIGKQSKPKQITSEIVDICFPTDNLMVERKSSQKPKALTETKQLKQQLKLLVKEFEGKEERFIATLEELNRSNKELEQYAYVASHDLQEPIRMISNYAQLLAKKYNKQLDETGEEYIRYLTEGAKRISTLIQDLLTYSRINTKFSVFESVNCNSILEDVLLHLKTATEEAGIKISHSTLPTITADCSQMNQLFFNLINNAIKFRRKEKPEISISTREGKGEWIFCFTDNGIGIKEEFYGKIFSMFQRLNDREKYPGNGIGLAICRRIVEKHKGRIWVESGIGKNTSFYFAIPKNIRQTRFISLAPD